MSLGLSMTGGLYRPVYWAFHRLFTEVLGVYRGQRELVDLPSLGTQASGNARWEREQGSEVPSRLTGVLGHVSESLLWRPTAGTRHRIRRLRLSRDFLTRPPPHRFPILGARITALSSLPHPPTKIENSAQGQLTSRTLKPPPIGHFYEFLCRANLSCLAASTARRFEQNDSIPGNRISTSRVPHFLRVVRALLGAHDTAMPRCVKKTVASFARARNLTCRAACPTFRSNAHGKFARLSSARRWVVGEKIIPAARCVVIRRSCRCTEAALNTIPASAQAQKITPRCRHLLRPLRAMRIRRNGERGTRLTVGEALLSNHGIN